MIVLTVLSYSGLPAEGLSARFDELGGSIGRADTNQLVLPDPERSISRLHARVVFRGGRYAIVDNGNNPIGVNGTALPSGREQVIQPGDQVQIGSYLLAVSQADIAKPSDPFAALFGDGAQGLAGPVAPATPGWGAAPAAPWPAAAAATRANAAPAAPPVSLLAEDWDFLADRTESAARGGNTGGFGDLGGRGSLVPAPSPGSPLGLSMGPSATDSLDVLFGLSKATLGGDPLGAAPSQALLLQPNTGTRGDPLQSLLRPRADIAASVSDHGSELNAPMPLPRTVAPPPAADGALRAVPAPSGAPSGAVFSWDDPPRDGRHVTLPGRPSLNAPDAVDQTKSLPSPGTPSAPQPVSRISPLDAQPFGELFDPPVKPVSGARPVLLVDPLADLLTQAPVGQQALLATMLLATAPSAVTAPAGAAFGEPAAGAETTAPVSSFASQHALLQALRQGLDVPGLQLEALTPELMLLIGQLLRESTRGAVELLMARAALKREMRAALTMIVARENNPLKFSPSVEVALQHLLSPPAQGFMPAAPAMRDAFDDLRAHQLGVMAGMRAALEGVLHRFDPQQLEGKLSKRSAIDSLIPATRKARLWESFHQLFSQLSSEAQDDFDELFGKAFLRAYEAQLDRLQAEPGPR